MTNVAAPILARTVCSIVLPRYCTKHINANEPADPQSSQTILYSVHPALSESHRNRNAPRDRASGVKRSENTKRAAKGCNIAPRSKNGKWSITRLKVPKSVSCKYRHAQTLATNKIQIGNRATGISITCMTYIVHKNQPNSPLIARTNPLDHSMSDGGLDAAVICKRAVPTRNSQNR